jgi:hypothetical protein
LEIGFYQTVVSIWRPRWSSGWARRHQGEGEPSGGDFPMRYERQSDRGGGGRGESRGVARM